MGGIALTVAVDADAARRGRQRRRARRCCPRGRCPDLIARRRGEEYDGDLLGTAVIAAVLLLMPLAVPDASAIAGFAGGAGGAAGRPAAGPRAHRADRTTRASRRCPTGATPPSRSTPRSAALGDPERFAHAQEIVTHAAPGCSACSTRRCTRAAGSAAPTRRRSRRPRRAEDPDERAARGAHAGRRGDPPGHARRRRGRPRAGPRARCRSNRRQETTRDGHPLPRPRRLRAGRTTARPCSSTRS